MMKNIYLIGFLILLASCNSRLENNSKLENESNFPELKNVNELKNSDFVPTLESNFSIKNNIIYGATIPLAWNEIKKEIGLTLTNFTNEQLAEINKTQSQLNVLKSDEYETLVEINDAKINAKAYFRKSLPFEEPLTKYKKPLKFGDSKVESFGFWGSCSYAKINYFKDENNFSISLFPENKNHEIILIMDESYNNEKRSFYDFFKIYNKEKALEKNQKIYFNDNDEVVIPIIEFNLEKSFDKIVGSKFQANNLFFEMLEVYQKNAFVFNENGAEVESEVEINAEEAMEELEKPLPKMMVFDKPFVVFLKRKEANFPYFAVYIANSELLNNK